jgi:hypothetical protein
VMGSSLRKSLRSGLSNLEILGGVVAKQGKGVPTYPFRLVVDPFVAFVGVDVVRLPS